MPWTTLINSATILTPRAHQPGLTGSGDDPELHSANPVSSAWVGRIFKQINSSGLRHLWYVDDFTSLTGDALPSAPVMVRPIQGLGVDSDNVTFVRCRQWLWDHDFSLIEGTGADGGVPSVRVHGACLPRPAVNTVHFGNWMGTPGFLYVVYEDGLGYDVGVHFYALSTFQTQAPLGDGNYVANSCVHFLGVGENFNMSGATVVGDFYYFLVDDGTDVWIRRIEMSTSLIEDSPVLALDFFDTSGFAYSPRMGQFIIYSFVGGTLHSYDWATDTLTEELNGMGSPEAWAGILQMYSDTFAGELWVCNSPSAATSPASCRLLLPPDIIPTSLTWVTDFSSSIYGSQLVEFSLADATSPLVDISVQVSVDAGLTWATASLQSGTTLTSLATSPGGTAQSFLWMSDQDVTAPNESVRLKINLLTPAKNVGTSFTASVKVIKPVDPVPPANVYEENLLSTLGVSQALPGEVSSGVELSAITLGGFGLNSTDALGDPLVRFVGFKNDTVFQIFDKDYVTITAGMITITGLTMAAPGTYDVLLLDRTRTIIAKLVGALVVV